MGVSRTSGDRRKSKRYKGLALGRRRGSGLFEKAARCPCPATPQDTESRDIDLEAHVANGGDAVRERYPAVDGEDVPDGRGAHPGLLKALSRANGTLLASVMPAAFTTVPITVRTPAASSSRCALATADSSADAMWVMRPSCGPSPVQ